MPADQPRFVPRLLWHPEQKLWNWRLARTIRRRLGGGAGARFGVAVLILADSLLLRARVRQRTRARGARGRGPDGDRPAVLYIDCGTHKEGRQIQAVQRWLGERYELRVLGFEASEEHVRDARVALADIPGVSLFHLALVGPDFEGDSVKLYRSSLGEGQADSLFANDRDEYDLVPARRLSQVLSEQAPGLDRMPVILRMNVEGAEHMIVEDLIAAGVAPRIDGFYGMWDDLRQVDERRAAAFKALLRENGIENLTFNDRDLTEPGPAGAGARGALARIQRLSFDLRRQAIRADIESAIESALARKGGAQPEVPA